MEKKFYIVLGATDAITAYICSKIGADYIWVSSFVLSSMMGLPDQGMVNIKDKLPLITSILKGATCPVFLDFDVGGKNLSEYRSQLKLVRNLPLGGICIEDEKWPKYNAMLKSPTRNLISPRTMAFKITIAKKVLTPRTIIIARTHSLIRGERIIKLQQRINSYQNAGADVICIHYTNKDWKFYEKVLNTLNISKPLMIIFSRQEFPPQFIHSNPKIKFIVFPNQIYRIILHPINSLKIKNIDIFNKNKPMKVKEIFKMINEINKR